MTMFFYCVKKYVRKPIKTTYDKNVWVKISNGKNVKILRLWYQTMVDENIKSIMIWKVGHSKRYDNVKNWKFGNIIWTLPNMLILYDLFYQNKNI